MIKLLQNKLCYIYKNSLKKIICKSLQKITEITNIIKTKQNIKKLLNYIRNLIISVKSPIPLTPILSISVFPFIPNKFLK